MRAAIREIPNGVYDVRPSWRTTTASVPTHTSSRSGSPSSTRTSSSTSAAARRRRRGRSTARTASRSPPARTPSQRRGSHDPPQPGCLPAAPPHRSSRHDRELRLSGAAVGRQHGEHNLIAEVVIAALRQALPDRTTALTGDDGAHRRGHPPRSRRVLRVRALGADRLRSPAGGRWLHGHDLGRSSGPSVSTEGSRRSSPGVSSTTAAQIPAARATARRPRHYPDARDALRASGLQLDRPLPSLPPQVEGEARRALLEIRWSTRTAASRPRLDRSADIVSPAKFSGHAAW